MWLAIAFKLVVDDWRVNMGRRGLGSRCAPPAAWKICMGSAASVAEPFGIAFLSSHASVMWAQVCFLLVSFFGIHCAWLLLIEDDP